MIIGVEVSDPGLSGTPGRARELLAETIGWDRVRELFPKS